MDSVNFSQEGHYIGGWEDVIADEVFEIVLMINDGVSFDDCVNLHEDDDWKALVLQTYKRMNKI